MFKLVGDRLLLLHGECADTEGQMRAPARMFNTGAGNSFGFDDIRG